MAKRPQDAFAKRIFFVSHKSTRPCVADLDSGFDNDFVQGWAKTPFTRSTSVGVRSLTDKSTCSILAATESASVESEPSDTDSNDATLNDSNDGPDNVKLRRSSSDTIGEICHHGSFAILKAWRDLRQW